MNLGINIFGSISTFNKISADIASASRTRGAGLLRRAGIEAAVTFTAVLGNAGDIADRGDDFTVIVVDGNDTALLARLADMRQNGGRNVPIIAIAPSEANLQAVASYCRVVSDWLFPDFDANELAFRLLAVVTGYQCSVHRLACGEITLARESRSMSLNGRSVRLTPSEAGLAEFFLNKASQVVSLAELVAFFEGTGKSSAMNNIRVAICQLRLKLEELSNLQLTIVTLYRQGYVLRQVHSSAKARTPPAKDELEAIA